MSLLAGALVAALAMVGFAAPASAARSTLCAGWTGCNAYGGDAGYGAASGTSVWGMFPGHNCTNYAAYRLQRNKVDASFLRGNGMAFQWGDVAKAKGIRVDLSPRVGDIAWWKQNQGGAGPYGHVAYVAEVGPGYFIVSEDNYGGNFHYVKVTTGNYPTGFIHFGGTPAPTPPAPTPSAPPPPVVDTTGLIGYWNRWNNGDHSALVGTAPAGARFEGTLGQLYSVPVPGTVALFSCYSGGDEFTSPDGNCEGQKVNRALGFIYSSPPEGVVTRAIYRCRVKASGEHFDSVRSDCEGQNLESRLGYAIAQVPLNRWNNGDHSALVGTAPAGARFEGTLGQLYSVPVPGTVALFSCYSGGDEFTSPDGNCEGQKVNRALGFIYSSPPEGVVTRAIYRCRVKASGEHFDSVRSDCEGQNLESGLGYALA